MLQTFLLGVSAAVLSVLVGFILITIATLSLRVVCTDLIHTFFIEREEHYKRVGAFDPEFVKHTN